MLSNMVKSVVAITGALIVHLGLAASAHAQPSVSANQPEYTMGDTAVLYGTGFTPGASLIVEIVRVDGQIMNGDGVDSPGEHPSSDTVVADSVGAFTYFYIVDGGPATAYNGIMTANVRAAASPSTVLATTTFIDGPHYLLQGCSKDRGNCNYDGSSSWASGSNPMNGWSASSVRGWYEGDDIAFRVRVGLRDVTGSIVQYFLTEQDYRTGGNFAIDYSTGFYIGAGPSVPGFSEGQLTKNCVLKGPLEAPLNELPTVGNPCIVTGPFYSGVDEDNQGGVDEDPADGIDNDMDGRVDEDPAPNGILGVDQQRIQYRWAVYFQSAETGTRDDKWALYWKGHAGAGSSSHGRIRSHSKSNYDDWDDDHDQDTDIDDCDDYNGSTGTDLRIVKTDSPDPVVAGNDLTYTLTVTNLGPNSASGVKITDTLPATVTFVSATWGTAAPPASQTNCTMSGGTVTCTIGAMSNGATRVATIVVRPLQGGTLTNTAIVSSTSTESAPANNTSTTTTTVTPSANLSIIKSDSPDPVLAGQNLTYTITVNNAGPSSATGVTVTDVLPANVALVSATPSQGTCSGTTTITCSIGTLNNAASATVTIVVTPTAAAAGTLSNTATVTSSVSDPNTSNNSSTTGTTVNPAANLSIIKSDSPDPVLAGQNLTYSITVTNNGPSSATGVTVTDTFPANVVLVSATPSQGSCSGTTTITCALGTVANAATATVTIVVTPGAAAVGTLSNTASVASSVTDPTPGNNSWTTTTTVNPAANLSVTKTDSPDPVLVGSNLTYTITVTNNGPNSATGVSVTDTLPAGVTWVSTTPSQGTCSGTATVTCSLGTLANAASATVTIVVTPTVANPTLSNTASATASESDPVSGNNSATTSTTVNGLSADLALNKTDSPDPVLVGQNLTYTITVTNLGPNSATSVTVSDPLPVGATWVSSTPSQGSCSGTSTVTCSLGILGNGASATVTIVVTPTVSGTLNNTASVTSAVSDPVPGNNSMSASTTVTAQADVSITKTDAPDPVLVGQNLTYTITVTNNGPNSATNVVMTDPLPAGATFVSSSTTQGSCTGTTTVSCTLGTLINGASATVTIVVTPTAAGTLSNTASVTANETDPNTANNSAPGTTTVNAPANQADLSITKTDSPDPVSVNGTLTYSITVTNNGPANAAAVTVTDTLPAGVTFTSATPSQGTGCVGTATVTCNLGTVNYPGSATVTLVVTVTPSAPSTITNPASVSSTTTDPVSSNNTASTTTSVLPQTITTDLVVTQTAAPTPVEIGANVTFTITVTNNGPDTATGVTLTNTLPPPANGTFVSVVTTQGTCGAPSGGIFTCSLGTIAPGAGNSVTITLVITSTATVGMMGNTASVAGAESETTTANNSASAAANVGDISRLINISTRAPVLLPPNGMNGGFILSGSLPKTLLIRGRGPSLSGAPFNISGTLVNPTIRLVSAGTTIAQNDNWQTTDPLCLSPLTACGNAAQITATLKDPCQPNPGQAVAPPGCANEAALLVTLPPGPYSVVLSGVSNGTGIGLFEVFDVDGTTAPKIRNISTRGMVQASPNLMHGGFIIGAGSGNKQVLIRARGPSMSGAPFNVPGTLTNPTLRVVRLGVTIAQNDNWQTTDPLCLTPAVACGNAADIVATGLDPCVPNPLQTVAPPNCANEAAVLLTLPPAGYNVVVSGVGNTQGLALFEVFEITP
ncbi:MAG: DUF11 domain-containing protein [Nitrospirota bacterium]